MEWAPSEQPTLLVRQVDRAPERAREWGEPGRLGKLRVEGVRRMRNVRKAARVGGEWEERRDER